MNSYIYSIIAVSVVGGIISTLTHGNESGIKKNINFIIGLICAIILLSPIISLISSKEAIENKINGFFDSMKYEEMIDKSNNLVVNTSIDKVCAGIKATIIDKYKFDEREVYVNAEINDESISSITISKIIVTLTGRASWSDVDTVKEYLDNLVGCNIEVNRK